MNSNVDVNNEKQLRDACLELLRDLDFHFNRFLDLPHMSLFSRSKISTTYRTFRSVAMDLIVKRYQRGFTRKDYRRLFKTYKESIRLFYVLQTLVGQDSSPYDYGFGFADRLPEKDALVVKTLVASSNNFLYYFDQLYKIYYMGQNDSVYDKLKRFVRGFWGA